MGRKQSHLPVAAKEMFHYIVQLKATFIFEACKNVHHYMLTRAEGREQEDMDENHTLCVRLVIYL
jgi:hypothetical protein